MSCSSGLFVGTLMGITNTVATLPGFIGPAVVGVLTYKNVGAFVAIPALFTRPISVWPHLFRGAGHVKRRGEQLKWSLAFRLYIGNFPCAQLPGAVHTARLGRVFFVYLT